MGSRTYAQAVVLAVVLAALNLPAWAEEQEEPPRRTFSSMLNVDALVDTYLRFVARKYNLTDEQDTFTAELVRTRVDDFLGRHRDELAELVDRLVEVRGGADIAPEELTEWGQRMQPIYQEAKGIIIQTNDEWRGILTEEQCRMHDEDIQLMYESFATTEDQLGRLVKGEMTVEEFRNPRRALQARRHAGVRERTFTPPRAEAGAVRKLVAQRSGTATGDSTASNASARRASSADRRSMARRLTPTGLEQSVGVRGSGQDLESEWERYVREFIERYELDTDQQSRAHKVLKKCQEQAQRYMRTRTPLLEKLERRATALQGSTDENKSKELAEIAEQRSKLLAPLGRIFEQQLKPRLERIPTRAQREAAAERGRQSPPQERKRSHKPGGKPSAGGGD